jgi:hypothetical protein
LIALIVNIVSPHAWKMPNVTGGNLQQAESKLGNINYNLAWNKPSMASDEEGSPSTPEVDETDNWTVCRQSPSPGKLTGTSTLYLAHTGYGQSCSRVEQSS